MVSFLASRPARWSIVESTNAAGTMIHTLRGVASLLTKSPRSDAPTAPSPTRALTASALTSKTTHSCPAFISRRTMLAPIRPRPIMPSCIAGSFGCYRRVVSNFVLNSCLSVAAALGPQQLCHRPGLEGAARGGVGRAAVGRLRHGAEAPFLEVQHETVEQFTVVGARSSAGVDVRPDDPGPDGALVVGAVACRPVAAVAAGEPRVGWRQRPHPDRGEQRCAGLHDRGRTRARVDRAVGE